MDSSFLTEAPLSSRRASIRSRNRKTLKMGNQFHPISITDKHSAETGSTKTRQEERYEEAQARLAEVRAGYNRFRLHHKLNVSAPDLDKVANLKLPLIDRERIEFGTASADRKRSKMNRRIKKSKTMVRIGIGLSRGQQDGADRRSRHSSRATSRAERKTIAAASHASEVADDLAAFFSPLKNSSGASKAVVDRILKPEDDAPLRRKGQGWEEKKKAMMIMNKKKKKKKRPKELTLPDELLSDEPKVGRKKKSVQEALEEMRSKASLPPTPMNVLNPVRSTDLSAAAIASAELALEASNRNKPKLMPKEREVQLRLRTRALDKMMGELDDKPAMTQEEMLKVIGFMDYNHSGEVDEQEFQNAVRAAKRGQIEDEGITKLMARVDNELRLKQIRLKDLFKQLDQSGDGVLSVNELQFGLNMLCDVSWDKECERRRLKRLANHDRWKNKEASRDKTKRWLTEVESLPSEFMEERDFFCRDIKTPARFEKYLEVVVSGPKLSAPPINNKPEEKVSTLALHFDLQSLDNPATHEEIKQIVDDEMSLESQQNSQEERGDNADDDSSFESFGDDSLGDQSFGDYSLGSSSIATDDFSMGDLTFTTGMTGMTGMSEMSGVSHASQMLTQIRKARNKKEQSEKEMESLIMLLGLKKKSLDTVKQRHFEEKLFKNLYKARTKSLSNDYYLPQQVLDVLQRDEMIKNVPKARRPSHLRRASYKVDIPKMVMEEGSQDSRFKGVVIERKLRSNPEPGKSTSPTFSSGRRSPSPLRGDEASKIGASIEEESDLDSDDGTGLYQSNEGKVPDFDLL